MGGATGKRLLPLNPLGALNDLLSRYYTIQQNYNRTEQDVRDLRSQFSALRDDHNDLKNRVSRLEEARSTTAAEVRAIIAETVGDLRAKFAEAQAALPSPRDD
jgi:septal ring factor EnvC (AmiA/AmiB activator)